jgi:ABC-type antimicrobial peptide transport system permease subunit
VFGDESPLGRPVPVQGSERPPYTIVGVARDASYYGFDEKPRLQLYASFMQMYQPSFAFLVKTTARPETLVAAVHEAIRTLDPDLAFPRTETLASLYDTQLAAWRSSARVVGLTGLIALLLASAGLFGVMSFRVSERTREIGLRMALGATRSNVARAVVDRGLRLTIAGAALGMAGAIAVGRFVQGMLYGVQPQDPVSLVAAPAVLIAVAVLAVLVPARRAMRIDPMRAMRSD